MVVGIGTSFLVSAATMALRNLVVGALFDEDEEVAGILKQLTESSGAELGAWANRLRITGMQARKIERSPTVFDVVALCWVERLQVADESAISGAFGISATNVLRHLDLAWAISALQDTTHREVAFGVGRQDPHEGWSGEVTKKITELFFRAAVEQIELNEPGTRFKTEDAELSGFIGKIIAEIPSDVEAHYLSLPEVNAVLARQAAESASAGTAEVLRVLSGEQAADEATSILKAHAVKLIGSAQEDVFRRDAAGDDQPGLMLLSNVYVEPLVLTAGKNPLLARKAIRRAWENDSNGIVVLSAVFGMGKSLTTRMLAVDMMQEWVSDPDANAFPLLLHAPDLLKGRAATLEIAIHQHLEYGLGLSKVTTETIWERMEFVLLIDSFDEVVLEKREAQSWIEEMQRLASNTRLKILLATRPYGVEAQWFRKHDNTFEIQPFDEMQVAKWLVATSGPVHSGGLEAADVIATLGKEMSGTPILLLMAAWVWDSETHGVAGDKTALYKNFINKISRGKWESVQAAHPFVSCGVDALEQVAGDGAFQAALALLAWEQTKKIDGQQGHQTTAGLSTREVEDLIRREFCSSKNPTEVLCEGEIHTVTSSMVLSMFFRRDNESSCVRFTHKSFREYLCAQHIMDRLKLDSGVEICSVIRLMMTEVSLDPETMTHLVYLCREAKLDKELLLISDACFAEDQHILFQKQDGVKVETLPDLSQIFTVRKWPNRVVLAKLNGERLGAQIRGLDSGLTDLIRQNMVIRSSTEDDDIRPIYNRVLCAIDYGYFRDSGERVFFAPAARPRRSPLRSDCDKWSPAHHPQSSEKCLVWRIGKGIVWPPEAGHKIKNMDFENYDIGLSSPTLGQALQLAEAWREANMSAGLAFRMSHRIFWFMDEGGAWRSPLLLTSENAERKMQQNTAVPDDSGHEHRFWASSVFAAVRVLEDEGHSWMKRFACTSELRMLWQRWQALNFSRWTSFDLAAEVVDAEKLAYHDTWEGVIADVKTLEAVFGSELLLAERHNGCSA